MANDFCRCIPCCPGPPGEQGLRENRGRWPPGNFCWWGKGARKTRPKAKNAWDGASVPGVWHSMGRMDAPAEMPNGGGQAGDGGVDPILRANRNLWIVFRRYHGLAFLR